MKTSKPSSRKAPASDAPGLSEPVKPTPTPAADDNRPVEAKLLPKKRGRPFKQNLICRDEAITIRTADSPTRPARRVKTDIKYNSIDSGSDADDDDVRRPAASPKRNTATGASTVRFQCQLCPINFKRNGWLKVHMQKAHSEPGPAAIGRKPSISNAAAAAATTSNATITSTTSITHESGSSAAAYQSDSDYSPPKPAASMSHRPWPELACDHCTARFKRPTALVQHLRVVHPEVAAVRPVETDSLNEIASIRAFFDALDPQHSSTVILHLEQMFKKSNKLMQWMKRQTALPHIDDFRAVNECQRDLLAKQLALYDTATQMIAAKRDSLQFAYDDFVHKHSDEPVVVAPPPPDVEAKQSESNDEPTHIDDEADEAPMEDIEDYSMSLNSGHFAVDITSDGQMIVTGVNGHAEGGKREARGTVQSRLVHRTTQTTESVAPALVSEIRIKDGDDFEFLDSKTGKLFTNKGGDDDADDDDLDLVELIEVDEEDEEDF